VSQKRTEMDQLQEMVRLHRMGTGYREVARLLFLGPRPPARSPDGAPRSRADLRPSRRHRGGGPLAESHMCAETGYWWIRQREGGTTQRISHVARPLSLSFQRDTMRAWAEWTVVPLRAAFSAIPFPAFATIHSENGWPVAGLPFTPGGWGGDGQEGGAALTPPHSPAAESPTPSAPSTAPRSLSERPPR
jgi:hypothetical protein